MNATICGIVDLLFKDTVDNAETRTLREELLNNCLEHYNDLIDRGLTETEAVDAVVESLKGMKEVINEYPKKTDTEKCEATETEEIKEKADIDTAKDNTSDHDRIFDSGIIRRIRSDLRSGDLNVSRSSDGKIHVRCENPEKIGCEAAGSLLRIWFTNRPEDIQNEMKIGKEDMSLKSILSFVGKAISKGFGTMVGGDDTTVYLELPEETMDEMVFHAMSGDITVEGCTANQMIMHTTSGDIRVQTDLAKEVGRLNAGSASGDIRFHGNAERVDMSSISGDVEMIGYCSTARLKSTSGDVHLSGSAQDVVTHTISGDQTIVLKNADASAIDAGSTSGDIEIQTPCDCKSVHTMIQTVSGDRNCRIPDAGDGAGLVIHAKTVSGDVQIL